MAADRNGNRPNPLELAPRNMQVMGSWKLNRSPDGRYQPHCYLITNDYTVIGEATLDFPNIQAGRVLAATIVNMLSKLPPEVLKPDGTAAAPSEAAAPADAPAAEAGVAEKPAETFDQVMAKAGLKTAPESTETPPAAESTEQEPEKKGE